MENTLYWVFSTIVQAFVALLALVGMVGIYRISTLERLFDRLLDSIEKVFYPDKLLLYQYPSREEKMKAIDDKIEKLSDVPRESVNKAKPLNARLKSTYQEEQIFKKYFAVFAVITIIDIMGSLISLGYTTTLAELPYIYISLIIVSVIVLSLFSLLSAILLVIRAIMPEALKKKITMKKQSEQQESDEPERE